MPRYTVLATFTVSLIVHIFTTMSVLPIDRVRTIKVLQARDDSRIRCRQRGGHGLPKAHDLPFLRDIKGLFQALYTLFHMLLSHLCNVFLVERTHLGLLSQKTTCRCIIDTVALLIVLHHLLLTLLFSPLERALLPPEVALHHLVSRLIKHR